MTSKGDSGGPGKVLGALCLAYIATVLLVQLAILADPAYLHEMQRALFSYHRLADPQLFPQDYITQVLGAFPRPYLYEWITRLWLQAGGDLVFLHRALPIACWLAFLAGTAMAARHLGGRITMLGAVAVAVAQPVYLHQIAAASPHAFGFPLFVWGLVALLHGSLGGLAFVTLLSGLLYPAATPVLGLLLAWQAFVAGRFFGMENRDRLKTVILVAGVAVVSLWLVQQALVLPLELGRPLAPLQQVEVYPENGPEGPYSAAILNPLTYVAARMMAQLRIAGPAPALALMLGLSLVGTYGFFALPRGSGGRRAVGGFILCSLAMVLVVYLAKPHHSYRFVLYPLFTVLPLLLVAGLQGLWRHLAPLARHTDPLTVAALALLVAAFDSLDPEKFGYWVHLEEDDRAVLEFAAAQPPDTLFAIWPQGGSGVEFIPYLARRPLLVMIKAHFPTHDRHVLAMRERMNALVDAYLATDAAPLQELGCRWGVDYLVAEKAHFAGSGSRPRYFAPFEARIEATWDRHRPGDFVLSRPEPAAVALENQRYLVLRLPQEAGPGSAGCAGQGSIEAAGAGL